MEVYDVFFLFSFLGKKKSVLNGRPQTKALVVGTFVFRSLNISMAPSIHFQR